MKILLVAHGLYPDQQAGIEIHTYQLAQALSETHEVFVFTRGWHGRTGGEVTDQRMGSLGIRWFEASDINAPVERLVQRAFEDYLSRIRPDVVHFQHLIHLSSSLPGIAARCHIPYLITLLDFWYLCPRVKLIDRWNQTCPGPGLKCARCIGTGNPSVKRWVSQAIRYSLRKKYQHRRLLNRTPLLLAWSEYTKARHVSRGILAEKILVRAPGVKRVECRRDPRRSDPHIHLGYLGTLMFEKGVHVLIEAVKKTQEPVSLRIHGKGPADYEHTLRDLAKNSPHPIEFAGPYDHGQLGAILSELDLVIVPSIWEELYGLVIDEALSAHVPVIASQIGGIGERIYNGVNGFLVPPNDAGALASAINRVARKYPESISGLRYDINVKDIRDEATDLIDIYEVVRQPRPSPVLLDLQDDVTLLAEFLGTSEEAVTQTIVKESQELGFCVRETWREAAPPSPQEIEHFYRTNTAFLFDLLAVHQTYERKIWTKTAVGLFAQRGVRSLVDYGGGIGDDCLEFHRMGFKVTLFEIESRTAEFAKLRFTRRRVNIPVVTDPGQLENYDAIYCTEVLEHLVNPMEVVAALPTYLRPKGILLVSHSFGLVSEQYPAHLGENRIYAQDFIGRVERCGFQFIQTQPVPGNTFYLFRKG